MRKSVTVIILLLITSTSYAQQVLTLEECRNLALANDKEQQMSNEEVKMAGYQKKAAFTKYFPELSLKGLYSYTPDELSLISQDMFLPVGTRMPDGTFGFTPEQINNNWYMENGQPVAPLDANGAPFDPKKNPEKIQWKGQAYIPKEELTYDIRNVYVGALNLTQPIFMGGKIVAYNKISKLNEELAISKQETNKQDVILKTDEAYWQVISLVNKKKAVVGLIELLDRMENDVKIMIETGVATKADELTVLVKKNEAEMSMLKVDNGIALSKMLLAQYCGMPLDQSFSLADEVIDSIPLAQATEKSDMQQVYANRNEVKSLDYAQQLYKQKEKIAMADMLPSVAFTANYLLSNPNLNNGFEKSFGAKWNVGVVVNIPLLHWGESIYQLNAARSETAIAELKLTDAKEKIELQVAQSEFKRSEALRKLEMTQKNLEKANENLRYATVGFEEGVIPASNLLEAQTAWLSANSDQIDAEIEAKMSEVYLEKAVGTLGK